MQLSRQEIDQRLELFRKACRARGLPLTPQKQAIFENVASTVSHPTAEEVYSGLKRRFPRLSFATVYKNLRQFLDMGLVRELRTAPGISRFDANVGAHAHVYRLKDGLVKDAPLAGPIPLPAGVESSEIDHVSLVYYLK